MALLLGLLPLTGCIVMPPANSPYPAPTRDANRQFQLSVQSWQSIRRENVVMQQTDYSCGAAALATLERYFWGDDVTEMDVLKAVVSNLTLADFEDRQKNGLSMTDLRLAAVKQGYLATIGRRNLPQLLESKVPVIVRIVARDQGHFVVVRGFMDDRVYLADPMRGNIRLSVEEFMTQWTDEVVLVVAKKDLTDVPTHTPLSLYETDPLRLELQAVRRAVSTLTRPVR